MGFRHTVSLWRSQGDVIVFTQGVFDVLHFGHKSYLKNARSYGDRLVVGLDSDSKVNKRKGEGRPYQCYRKRLRNILELEYVDIVIKKNVAEKWAYLAMIKPDVWVIPQLLYDSNQLAIARNYVESKIIRIPRVAGISTSMLLDKRHNKSI